MKNTSGREEHSLGTVGELFVKSEEVGNTRIQRMDIFLWTNGQMFLFLKIRSRHFGFWGNGEFLVPVCAGKWRVHVMWKEFHFKTNWSFFEKRSTFLHVLQRILVSFVKQIDISPSPESHVWHTFPKFIGEKWFSEMMYHPMLVPIILSIRVVN